MTETSPVIFVLDDDESVRTALKRLIRSAGLNVETFCSAEDFLNYSRHDAPGCLILDVWMPGMSGLDLQDELAASDFKMPIIFITAHDDEDARSQAMKAGALAFLQKPFEDQDLLDAIHKATNRNGSKEHDDGSL